MKIKSLIISIFVLSFFCSADTNTDWPQWRGQDFSGVVNDNNTLLATGKPHIAWKRSLGSGYSSISVVDNIAVTMFSDGTFDYVIALDATTGKTIWQYTIDDAYLGHDGSHDGPISTPTIYKKNVFVLAAKGQLLALKLTSGELLWQQHLAKDKNAKVPFYGFGTSPIPHEDKIFVQAGENNNTISAFNIETGAVLWSAGTDSVNYQVPLVVDATTIISAGDQYLLGLDIDSGEKKWEYHHQGRGMNIMPIVIDQENKKFFFQYKSSESILLKIENNTIEKVWTTKGINQTYAPAVYNNDYIYGYGGRFFSCVDANSGKKMWKSREPGDGFCIMANNYLIIITKTGSLHIAKASPQEYQEIQSLDVFTDLVWTPPSYANNNIYVRSLGEIACISFSEETQQITIKEDTHIPEASSPFQNIIALFEKTENKEEITKQFFEKYTTFPIIEGDFVHFVYHGAANEMAIESDIVGFRSDDAMNRILGTNIFYYSVPLEKNARIQYRFMKNLEEYFADPLNPNNIQNVSYLEMPEWKIAEHLSAPEKNKGTIEEVEVKQDNFQRKIQIYLPENYHTQLDHSFPVMYVHGGSEAIQSGLWVHSLDNSIGNAIVPIIAVFVPEERNEYYQEKSRIVYMDNFIKHIVPFIDKNYRTQKTREGRVNYGAGSAGVTALFCTLTNQDMFSGSASQSAFLLTIENAKVQQIIPSLQLPITFYLEWGKYDLRSPLEGWSILRSNRQFAGLLQKENISFYGGEQPIGFDWVSWRNQNQQILMTFFAK